MIAFSAPVYNLMDFVCYNIWANARDFAACAAVETVSLDEETLYGQQAHDLHAHYKENSA